MGDPEVDALMMAALSMTIRQLVEAYDAKDFRRVIQLIEKLRELEHAMD